MMLLASVILAGCLAVAPGSDQVSARDLAPAFPEVDALPEAVVALAPAPGVRRYFGIPELGRIAARLNLSATPARELCFERPLLPLEPARLLEAMHKALPDAVIEILDYSRWGAPQGEMQFSLTGLRRSSAATFWNGEVHYAGSRRYLIWAKVKVTVERPSVVATEDLPAGRVVDASVLRVETVDSFPEARALPATIKEVSGRMLRRPVRSGAAIRPEWLEPARDVHRGDTVRVEVLSGGARLEFEGRATASGSTGQTVWVLNPETNRRFPARVKAPGQVTVEKAKQ